MIWRFPTAIVVAVNIHAVDDKAIVHRAITQWPPVKRITGNRFEELGWKGLQIFRPLGVGIMKSLQSHRDLRQLDLCLHGGFTNRDF